MVELQFFVLFCLKAFSNFSVVHIHCFCIEKKMYLKFLSLRFQDIVADLNACLNWDFSFLPLSTEHSYMPDFVLVLEIAVDMLAVDYWLSTCFTILLLVVLAWRLVLVLLG